MEDKNQPNGTEELEREEVQTPPAGEQAQAAAQEAEPKEEKKSGWRDKLKKEDPREAELKKLQDDYAALNDKYLRLMAEYDNFRKRSQRERDSIYPEATAAAVGGFLAVVDTFERALAAECSDPEYKKGTELTYKSLIDVLGKLKVEAFGQPGETFDPNCHNAVMHIEDESLAPGTVAEVFQRGYRLGDRVLRAAMVKVAN